MKLPKLRTVLLAPIILFVLFYVAGAISLALRDDAIDSYSQPRTAEVSIAIFGASGTAGDGILQAALADPDLTDIHVFTRRVTPRMEQGVADGKLKVTMHQDYLDYTAILDAIRDVDAVFWAIGTSTVGVDEKTYGMIHVDFPVQFVSAWSEVSSRPDRVFHYISSSDISEDSSMMWAREKVRAEKALFGLADERDFRVVAYRPDYIGPTDEEAHLGQDILYWFFAPVGAAVKATQIGQAMLELNARQAELSNGDKFSTWRIIRLSDAYERHQASGQ
jgi:hypothetical protein